MKSLYALIFFCFIFWPLSTFALTPDDTDFDEQWYLNQIEAPAAWDVQTGSDAVIVAILDSGFDLDHPDLFENLWVNPGELEENGVDDDGNGFVDDQYGWDFVEGDNVAAPNVFVDADADAAIHGSLIAGLIGAVGSNAEGVAGVAWDVQLMPLRTLDEFGSGSSNVVAEAIYYAVENGADVINLSFSGTVSDPTLSRAIQDAYEAGVVIVAAMGNENVNVDAHQVYPVCYGTPEDDWVIGVTATTALDTKASFSNFGETCADIAAPGVDIFGVSYQDDAFGFDAYYQGGWTGTSMSAPLVAGAAALLLSEHPSLTPEDVRLILQLSVDPVSGPQRKLLGSGRLNVARALEIAGQFVEDEPEEVEVLPKTVVDGEVMAHENFRAPSFNSVYRLTEENTRRVFINENTFFTWADGFDEIEYVDDVDLSLYTIGGLVLPKAGVVLVKIQSDPTVYALEENPDDPYKPLLRAISTEFIARQMYGEHWADFVIDIEPTYFAQFGRGADIISQEAVDTTIMKTRVELAALAQ